MPANMVLIEKITVGAAGASSVTFSGIPQTGYTDLVLAISPRSTFTTNTWDDVRLEFNGSGGTAYSTRMVYGDGTSPASASTSGNATISWSFFSNNNSTANTFGNIQIYIPNYTSSNYKSISSDSVAETNGTATIAALTAGLWSNTSAITSIKLTTASGGNYMQYSTFYLYGVAKLGTTPAIQPYATGGDTIMTDGTYWYHTFLSSGTFTPATALSCDYLVVAGGGGGGHEDGGGGGAGGLRSTVTATGGGGSLESKLSLASATAYTVTVGAGGAGSVFPSGNAANGSNSVFSTITSTGGGAAGSEQTTLNGQTGGSGGAGSGRGSAGTAGTGGAGTANQGYAGGNGVSRSAGAEAGGGGGGAGAVGAVALTGAGGAGGTGVATSISGSSVTYAGGGGGGASGVGGAGGAGGGGQGGSNGSNNSTAGTANTGGGGAGGGGNDARNGTNGGSGIVIVRYTV